jgi:hypothetical protein
METTAHYFLANPPNMSEQKKIRGFNYTVEEDELVAQSFGPLSTPSWTQTLELTKQVIASMKKCRSASSVSSQMRHQGP